MTKALLIILIFIPFMGLCQEYMVENGDTVPYKLKLKIIKNDTFYSGSCNTLDYKNGEAINRKINCIHVGYWEKENDDGTISKGWFSSNGKLKGAWKTYNLKGELIKEIDYASIAGDTYVLEEIHYNNGVPVIISKKTWFAKFFLRNVIAISIILFISFNSRIFINSSILNIENNTNYFPIYIIGPVASDNFIHSLGSTFTFWWVVEDIKPENKKNALISNILSIFSLTMFFSLIIGLALSGEIG